MSNSAVAVPDIVRYAHNPILKPEPDCPWGQSEARNTAAYYDGKQVHLLFTAGTEAHKGNPLHLGHAVSDDGFNFQRDPEPWLSPSQDPDDFDYGTVEDPRITAIGDEIYVTYAARWFGYRVPSVGWPDYPRRHGRKELTWHDEHSRRTGLVRVTQPDFSEFERLGPLTQPHVNDANTVLFPEKYRDMYFLLHRPTPFRPHKWNCHYAPAPIFIAFSRTLMPWDWSNFEEDVLLIRPKYDWEGDKVGGSGPPIKTDEGWLVMYHAMDNSGDGHVGCYRVGLLLLDLDEPWRVIARSPVPIMEPSTENEKVGRVDNVVFPCGNVVIGDDLFIYYGAADTDTCVATVKLADLVDYAKSCRL
jgi:predicted GH43/DUF377 family glycosyl hydrolase